MTEKDAVLDAEHDDDYTRLPGLFRRWEIEAALKAGMDFHLEEAGYASDGSVLYVVFTREPRPNTEIKR